MVLFTVQNNAGGVILAPFSSVSLPLPTPAPVPAPVHDLEVDTLHPHKRPHEDSDVIEVDVDQPGQTVKKPRSGGHPTTDPVTVQGWKIVDENGKDIQSIWGYHRSGNSDKDQARKKKADEMLKVGKVVCWWCGDEVAAFKARLSTHVLTAGCTKKRQSYLTRHQKNVGSGNMTSVDVEWLTKETNLLYYQTKKVSLPLSETQKNPKYLKSFLVGVATTKGISLRAMDDLFSKTSDFRMGLQRIDDGLGSDKTCADHQKDVITRVHEENVLPAFRFAVDNDLPICIASDESPGKGHPVLLAHLFHPGLKEPICIDVGKMNRACDHTRLIQGLKDLVIRNSFLTVDEWEKHVVIFSGDHAAYVIKAAKEANCEHAGDPAHALDLVVKAIIKACHLKPVCMALRKIFTSKSYVVSALLKAIDLKGGTSIMKIPTTRWGYFPKLLHMLSQPTELAKIQETILWMYHHMYDGPLPLPNTSLLWIKGVPFKPESYDVSLEEEEESEVDDGGDWGEERAALDDVDEEEVDEVEDKEGESLTSIKERRRKTCLQLLAVLSNPQVVTLIMMIVKLTGSLRSAQVEAQSSTARDSVLIEKFKRAYQSIKEPLVSEDAFKTWVGKSTVPIQVAEDLTSRAQIVRLSDGAFTITNMPLTPKYTVGYKKASDSATDRATGAAMKEILEQVRGPIHAGAIQYEKLVYKCFYVVQRRFLASLVKDLGHHTTEELRELLNLDDALPPSLRKGIDKTRTTTTGGWDDDDSSFTHSSTKILSQWMEFMQAAFIRDSACYLTDELRKTPHKFWMNVRVVYPELGNTMLYWLAHPVGTAGLERDFSGMTIECRNFRRSRTQWPTFRASVLCRCYSDIIARKLKEALS
jgi:hypothetical protein